MCVKGRRVTNPKPSKLKLKSMKQKLSYTAACCTVVTNQTKRLLACLLLQHQPSVYLSLRLSLLQIVAPDSHTRILVQVMVLGIPFKTRAIIPRAVNVSFVYIYMYKWPCCLVLYVQLVVSARRSFSRGKKEDEIN